MIQKVKKCTFCNSYNTNLIVHYHNENDKPLLDALHEFKKGWNATTEGVCTRCLSNAHERLQNKLLNADDKKDDAFGVLPTPLRLNAHPDYSGKGVTICFIDSGFYPHPDIADRILKIHDITQPRRGDNYFLEAHENAWHGTMTSVVCAGNGQLSNTIYRGVANNASLVLLKVSDEKGQISGVAIAKALKWVIKNHKAYNIRIVNLSVTDDEEISFRTSEMAGVVRRLTKKGITVVAAVGNDRNAPILPPANIPEVLTIGGFDDRNTLDPFQQTLYHSTSGVTIDGLLKPELIAPAIWLAVPILPKSVAQTDATEIFAKYYEAKEPMKSSLVEIIKEKKLLSPHYQHSDGTSFAAPIVCAIIAQMLEANPVLTQSMIREILLTTARPLSYEDHTRQGYGVVQAAHAVMRSKNKKHLEWTTTSPILDVPDNQISFFFHNDDAKSVAIAGDFNNWSTSDLFMKKQEGGFWQVKLPMLPKGDYHYKYVINGYLWANDPLNPYRVEDGYGLFNSRFFLE